MTKTQNKICKAMVALLKEMPYEKITVQEIVGKAKVSRSSFYNHFERKEDVISLMIEQLCDNLAGVEEFAAVDTMDDDTLTSVRTKILDYYKEHRDTILLLFKAGFGGEFSRTIKMKIYEIRQSFAYEFEDEKGNKQILSDGILYDLKTWSDVNDTVSAFELYYEKYSDMTSAEYDKMVKKANHLTMTGKFYKK